MTHGACRDLHGGLAHDSTRCWAVRLRDHSHDLNDAALAKTVECLERANRELRGAEEESALC
jgi:hypothetical protein